MQTSLPNERNSNGNSNHKNRIKPAWAGDDWLSRFVNLLIKTKPIYALLKQQARRVMIKTAEKNGIAWRDRVRDLEASDVNVLLATVTDPQVSYPDYYQVPFHAYAAGNLSWQAAFEVEPATYAMALRVWPQEKLTATAAQTRLRSSFHQALAPYLAQPTTQALDIGCSVGISTLALHRFLQIQVREAPSQLQTRGLDLSPYFLAVAQQQDSDHEISEWRHAQAEATGFESDRFDLVTLQFVLHELPRVAAREIFAETLRILRPGGLLAIVDNNPASPVIQSLPPALFTLMKSTEPWSDDYYTFNVEAALQDKGFEHLQTAPSDPRHRTILGRKPAAR